MWVFHSKVTHIARATVSVMVMVVLVFSTQPPQLAFAQNDTTTDTAPTTASSTDATTSALNDGSPDTSPNEEDTQESHADTSASSTAQDVPTTQQQNDIQNTNTDTDTGNTDTPVTTASDSDTASTSDNTSDNGMPGGDTDSGTDGSTAPSTDVGSDGSNGQGDAADGQTASSTAQTASSTPVTGEGDTGEDGTKKEAGSDGTQGTTGSPGADGEAPSKSPLPVKTENDIGDSAVEDNPEDSTGGIARTGRNTRIDTGDAQAKGEVDTDVNASNLKSINTGDPNRDLDTYTFSATGTNEAVVDTSGTILSNTGDNTALSTSASEIYTGDAFSALNVANVVNSNIVNSDGFLYLRNTEVVPGESLDLRNFFFPNPEQTKALADDCTLLSCMSEDIIYNLSQDNDAVVTNTATIKAITGENTAEGDYASIETGNAYGGANIINVVNANIIDSNYRLLALNAMGDLSGDLMLPTEELFKAFFGRPNGMTQTENAEEVTISINNSNDGVVENNLETYAETGLNTATTQFDSDIQTGAGESESNVVNRVNTNIYGGDSFYLLIRVHGVWSGDVIGLPDGLTWQWTPDGILIYNEDAEIVPSTLLPYDVDSYSAYITDTNTATVTNDVSIDAVTGENSIDGLVGSIKTGDAYASANVLNIVNTNVIGTNWTLAVINVFGDFDGNVTFAQTDLSLTGTIVEDVSALQPGDLVSYQYTITNNSDTPAQNVTLRQTLQNARGGNNATQQTVPLGSIAPGASVTHTLQAVVNDDLPYGSSTVMAIASVQSDESDNNESDNSSLLTFTLVFEDPNTVSNTPQDDTSTRDPNSTEDTEEATNTTPVAGNSGGGGGGGSRAKTKSIDRYTKEVDPDAAPLLFITKEADVPRSRIIKAGEFVDYTIKVRNGGGAAYDAVVYDTLRNPIGAVISEQSWDLGTILPGEEITLSYTTAYDIKTPSGRYTNTARIEAYRSSTTKAQGGRPLKLDDAVHTIVIEGVALAVGNVGVLAYFPGADGKISALVTWETSTSSTARVYYSPLYGGATSTPFNVTKPNFGYAQKSFMFQDKKTKHLMIITGLQEGVVYTYRIRANDEENIAFGGDYTFTVPSRVRTLTLAGYAAPRVAGVSTSKPQTTSVTPPAPAVVPYTKPKVVSAPTAPAVSKPPLQEEVQQEESQPEPEQETVPEDKPAPQKKKGFLGGFVKKVFGFFR